VDSSKSFMIDKSAANQVTANSNGNRPA